MENEEIDKGEIDKEDDFWTSIIAFGGAFFFLIAEEMKWIPINRPVAFIFFAVFFIAGCCLAYSHFKKTTEEKNKQP